MSSRRWLSWDFLAVGTAVAIVSYALQPARSLPALIHSETEDFASCPSPTITAAKTPGREPSSYWLAKVGAPRQAKVAGPCLANARPAR